jgi:hypothetical protein
MRITIICGRTAIYALLVADRAVNWNFSVHPGLALYLHY